LSATTEAPKPAMSRAMTADQVITVRRMVNILNSGCGRAAERQGPNG